METRNQTATMEKYMPRGTAPVLPVCLITMLSSVKMAITMPARGGAGWGCEFEGAARRGAYGHNMQGGGGH
jgi:hypothetical protein